MRTTDVDEIRLVLQRVRSKRRPDVPAGFIDAVLDAEASALEDDAAATQRIRQALEACLPPLKES